MSEHDVFRAYLEKVCEQIRWKKARPVIHKELGDHLEDKQAALIASGSAEDEAANEAVRDMGDALLVGSQLDRSYRPRPAWGVIAVTVILMIVGYYARDYIVHNINSHRTVDVPRSLFFLGAAVVALIVGYFLDYTILGKHPLLIGAGFAAVVMLLPFFDLSLISNNLDYRAYYYGTNLAPFIPLIYAAFLWWWPYKGYGGLIGSYLVLIFITFSWLVFGLLPYAIFHCGICGIMLTAEVLKGKFNIRKSIGMSILYVPVALVGLVIGSSLLKLIARRLSLVMYPWLDPEGAGFMGVQIRQLINGAKWIGRGSYTTDHLSAILDDAMLTVLIHKVGWISFVGILFLFGALFTFSFLQVRRTKSKLGRFTAIAVLSTLMLQCFIYIFNNLFGYFSLAVLPLLSFGNAELLVDSFLIGLMLSVFRTNDVVTDAVIEPRAVPRFRIRFERLR